VQGTDPDSAGPMPANAQEGIAMKTSRVITAAGRAAVAATPTVASCPDGQYVPVSPQPLHTNGTQS
jgi:hypothetical protein